MLCAKIVYDEEQIEEFLGKKTEKEYKEKIWDEIKEINKKLPDFKHIKKIEITKEEFVKTTTHKIKRYMVQQGRFFLLESEQMGHIYIKL